MNHQTSSLHFVALITLALLSNGYYCAEFSYQDQDEWGGVCNSGSRQSPILLDPELSINRRMPVGLTFNEGYSAEEFWLQNDGHTITAAFRNVLDRQREGGDITNPTSDAFLTGYGLPNTYIFAQVHFHWGDDIHEGSEHLVQNKSYALEVHLVHYNAKYTSFSNAVASGNSDALAVLGVFFSLGEDTDSNPALDTIVNSMGHAEKGIFNVSLDLSSLLPKPGASFFRYSGSLTTPMCSEIVEWTVVEEPIPISHYTIEAFDNVMSDVVGTKIGANFRRLQTEATHKNPSVQYLVIEDRTSSNGNSHSFFAFLLFLCLTIQRFI